MQVYVAGKHKSVDTQTLKRAARFYANELLPPHIIKKLKLFIHFKTEPDENGFAIPRDVEYCPTRYYVGLDPALTHAKALRILAHEMIHVKQWALNEMRDCYVPHVPDSKYRRFKSRKFYDWDPLDTTLPWEREAYRRESRLYEKLREAEKLRGR